MGNNSQSENTLTPLFSVQAVVRVGHNFAGMSIKKLSILNLTVRGDYWMFWESDFVRTISSKKMMSIFDEIIVFSYIPDSKSFATLLIF